MVYSTLHVLQQFTDQIDELYYYNGKKEID